MTNPVLQTMGRFFPCPIPFHFPPFRFFSPSSTTILFSFCSLCVSDTTACFHSATRNYPEKLTCQPTASPSVPCEHLFTEGHWPWTGSVWAIPTAGKCVSSLPLALNTHFFFWCSTLKTCSVTQLHSRNYRSGIITLDNSLPHWHIWTVVVGELYNISKLHSH